MLVLERGLTAAEEAELIKITMANIDQETFIGIEMQSYSHEDVKRGNWLSKLLRRKQQPRMSVIGPADLLKTIHKDGNMIQTMILTRETIVGEEGKEHGEPLPEALEDSESPDERIGVHEHQNNEPTESPYLSPSDANEDAVHPEDKEYTEED